MVNCCRLALVWIACMSLLLLSSAAEGLQVNAAQTNDDDAKEEVLKWRAEHEARFRSATGWLALTGHYWLKPGDNRLGASEDCAVSLPADAAKSLVGIFKLNDNKVSLTVMSGGPLLVDGREATQAELPIDATLPESDCAAKLEIGDRLKLQLVRRAGRFAVRVRDSQSDLIKSFAGKSWFDVDAQYRVQAKYHRFEQPKSLKIVNVKGDEVDSKMAGSLEFQWKGQTYQLDAIEESPDSLFVIFKDRTNGQSTYGAGRFVDVSLPADKDGNVVIDFNKTYSPPCAWSPHTLCPLPPKQNHLPIAIEAGEKKASK